jgi:hypothetical protein
VKQIDVSRETLYNVHVSNEQCKNNKRQYVLLANMYWTFVVFIGRMPVNEKSEGF